MPFTRKAEEYPPKSGILIASKINPSGSRAFRVDISPAITGTAREQRQFASKGEARAYAERRHSEIVQFGHAAFALTALQRSDAFRALELLKDYNLTLEDAAKMVVRQMPQKREQLTVSGLFQKFIQAPGRHKSRAMHRRPLTIMNLTWRIARFKKAFDGRMSSEIRTEEIQRWISSLGEQSPVSLNNYRRVLHAMFSFGVSEGYCLSNPVTKIPLFAVAQRAPSILTVEQAGKLARAAAETNEHLGLLGYVVLGLFAGLRRAEICRLDWSAIKWERQMVTVSSDIAKTGSIRNVSLTDNAMDWLRLSGATAGNVAPLNSIPKFRRLRSMAGIEAWDGNEMRHSFASYHYDLHQNGPLTAAQLGHSSGCHLLFEHYRSLVPLGEGGRYFAIKPA